MTRMKKEPDNLQERSIWKAGRTQVVASEDARVLLGVKGAPRGSGARILTLFSLPKSIRQPFPGIERLVFKKVTVLLSLATKICHSAQVEAVKNSLYAVMHLK